MKLIFFELITVAISRNFYYSKSREIASQIFFFKYQNKYTQKWMCERQPSSSVTLLLHISYQLLLYYYYMPYVFLKRENYFKNSFVEV